MRFDNDLVLLCNLMVHWCMQDLATLWEMHAGTPEAALTELEGGSDSEEDVERELEHSMSRHLGSEDGQGSLKGRLQLRWLWLAFWAGAFLRERFSDARWTPLALCQVG